MPKSFERCVKKGGRVRTITKGGNKGRKICFGRKGKASLGEKKRKR